MTTDSSNTVAVVVGIEDYEISRSLEREARWDLDGPASDAVRFVRWLKSQNVPSGNIHVFLSAMNEGAHHSALETLGISNLLDAKQKTLEDFLLNQLPALARDGDCQLVLLWGGHGILRASEERHLYCADVLSNTLRTIWLNDLLTFLRSLTGFPRQYIFVDACANAHEDTGLKSPFHHRFGVEQAPAGVEQYALLAASAGQLAVNLRDSHAGLFSTFLFEVLESSISWPPFQTIEETVLDRFAKKFAEDPTFNQRPVSLTFVDHTNRRRSVNYGGIPVPRSLQALAEETGYSVVALQKLVAAASRCASLAAADGRTHFYRKFQFHESPLRDNSGYDLLNLLGRILLKNLTGSFLQEVLARESDLAAYLELRSAFQQAFLVRTARAALRHLRISTSQYRRIFSLLQTGHEPSNVEEMLDTLAARGPVGSCALFDFMFRVADCGEDPELLCSWVREHADARHYADLEQRRKESRSYSAIVSIKPALGKDEIPESFTLWLLEDGRATGKMWTERFVSHDLEVIRTELMSHLEVALVEAIEAGKGPVFVEIAVPMRLMRWRFDQLGVSHANSRFKHLLSREHPVVLRWRDRQRPNAIWSKPWRRASAFIRSRSLAGEPRWMPLPDDPDESFLRTLEEPPAGFLFLGACEPPREDVDPDWLQEVIIAGMPFVGWMADPPANPERLSDLLDKLLRGEFDELPLRLPDVRRDERSTELHHLILLWDDPGRSHTVLLEEPA